jgi:hypothetical protein
VGFNEYEPTLERAEERVGRPGEGLAPFGVKVPSRVRLGRAQGNLMRETERVYP